MTERANERVFLVVADNSPEMPVALRYAARRAARAGGRIVLLYVITPPQRMQFMALESLLRDEQRQEAEAMLEPIIAQVVALTGVRPGVHLREGQPRDELLKLLDEDPSISILVLAAGTGDSGPGLLVSELFTRDIASLRVPVTVVPGSLDDATIDAIT